MESYKPNPKPEQKPEEPKRVQKVVSSEVKTKKRLSDVIFAQDIKTVLGFVAMDVILPHFKKTIVDSISEGAHKLFFGDSARTSSTNASRVSYRGIYDFVNNSISSKPSENRNRTTVFDYESIVIEDRAEAEEVLTRMDELIETYGVASVADLYDLVGITCEHTDNNYGWTNLRNAKIERLIGGGYRFKLPKALPIKK